MYDRRIVRGNTFAALVIPVNMQPASSPVKKPSETAGRPHYMQGTEERNLGYQQSDQALRSNRAQENKNDWEELSDVSR